MTQTEAKDETVDTLLKNIRASAESTEESIRKLISEVSDEKNELPQFLKDISGSSSQGAGGVSLLTLKNSALLSYVNSLAVLMLLKVESVKEQCAGKEVAETSLIAKSKESAVNNTIVQRVVLERGVKGLEKKISYQLDKMVRAYNRAADLDNKKKEAQQTGGESRMPLRERHNSNEDESDEDEDDSDAELNFKPNALALSSKLKQEKVKEEGKSSEKYRPPKISAVAPPTATGAARAADSGKSASRRRKLQSMEEYIREHGDAPTADYSIGSNILDHGRGGVKTTREQAKENEVTRYEEENFTRLPTAATKKSTKDKRRQEENTFFGEDWSIFGNSKGFDSSSASRRKKPASAWDRAKRRRT